MKTSKHLLIVLALMTSVFTACKKEGSGSNHPDKPKTVNPVATPIGTSKGAIVTKQIGAAGGQITSADQQITVTIPAGALNANTNIGIEPITNTNIAGMGTAFRLTPHGQTFAKPVEITLSWADHADSIGLLQTLGLAYQMENRVWKFVGATSVDAAAKTLTFKTTHFSDWSLMNQVSLSPYKADLEPGQTQTITALLFTEIKDGHMLVPLAPVTTPGHYEEPGYPVGHPEALPAEYIKQWKLGGPGKINPVSSNVVNYQAPASVNSFTTAAVSLELKAPADQPGQFLLVSNINIIGGSYAELSIGGGEAVSFPVTISKSGNRYLVANPEDEGGGYFLLTWVGGVGGHGWDMSNTGTYLHFITPSVTYVSRYRTDVYYDLVPSEGSVSVTRLSGGWAEGTFVASKAGMSDTFIPTTTLSGKFKVKMLF